MNADPASDADLLRQFVGGSEPAFRELVRRHLGMVHATARRILASVPHLTDDVTQTVFTDLARRASALPSGVILAGWLHRHACYVALNTARAERRRRARERTSMEIISVNENSGRDAHWAQLAPVLDDALNHLDDQDRDAIVLRYLEQHNLRTVGLALGINDDTAQKRVSRALEKLRRILLRSGLSISSASALATSLDARPDTPLSANYMAAISTGALSGPLPSATTSIFATLKTMIASKLALQLTLLVAAAGIGITTLALNAALPASTNPKINASAPTTKPPSDARPSSPNGALALPPEASVPETKPAVPATSDTHSTASNIMQADFPNTEIRNILISVAKQLKLNLVVPDTLKGIATVKLQNTTWQQVFKTVLDPVGYTYVMDGDVIVIKRATGP